MNVERQLQISMAALAALGTLLLGMGQQTAWLPFMAAIAVLVSVYVTDIAKVFQLNRNLANAAAVGALLISLREFLSNYTKAENQLLVIANLLIYLQIVLVFQRKNDRVYWLLAVLSLLQVVVAAALNMGFAFGLLLIVYLVVALTALFLFFLHRETRVHQEPEEDDAPASDAPASEAQSFWNFLSYLGVPDQGEEEAAPRKKTFEQAVVYRDRGNPNPLRVFQGWSMMREVAGLTLATIVFTGVIFYSVPRFDDNNWRWGAGGRSTEIGFSPDVSLIDGEQMSLSDDVALRVTWTDMQSGEPVTFNGDPYLRGAVAVKYTAPHQEGSENYQWKPAYAFEQRDDRVRRQNWEGLELPSPASGVPLVRQEVILATFDNAPLFSTYPVFRLPQTDDRVRFESRTEQLYYHVHRETNERPKSVQFRYVTGIAATIGGLQGDITPRALMPFPDPAHITDGRVENGSRAIIPDPETLSGIPDRAREDLLAPFFLVDPRQQFRLVFGSSRPLTKQDPPELVALRDFAENLVKDIPADQAYRRAKLLENHFRLSPTYQYALNLDTVPRDKSLDPNVDFVTNHHTGNCRHFASALALMLRSLGIPARLVTGYRGGEYNSVGNYWVVRQNRAHAWVEAYLEPSQIPDAPLGLEPQYKAGGAWLRLDPTPEGQEDVGILGEIGWLDHLGEMVDYVQMLWNDYVVNLNPERQKEAIFEPLVDGSLQTAENMTSASAWQGLFESIATWLGFAPNGWFARHWYIWLTLWCLLMIGGGAWSIWRYGANLWRFLFGGGTFIDSPKRRGESVDFYLKLEDLLARHGHTRGQAQTAREFAVLVGAELPEEPRGRDAAALVRQLVDRFYHVRYGGEELSADDRVDITRRLGDLEKLLTVPKPTAA